MQRGLIARLVTILVSIFLAVWILVPSFLNKEDQARMDAAAERAADPDLPEPSTPDPWYIQYLQNKKIVLGLDLQGGLELTLDVVTEDAVLSTVQRDILPLQTAAAKDGIQLVDVRRDRKAPRLKIAPGDGVTLEQVTNLVGTQFRYYKYESSVEENGKKYLVFSMNADEQANIATRSVEQALETIRNRVNATGVKEPAISRKGDRGIDVQLPGESNVDQAVAAIGTTARLEFILVDEEADTNKVDQGIKDAKSKLTPEEFNDDRALSEWLQDNNYLPGNRQLLWQYSDEKGQKPERRHSIVLKGEVILTGDDINDAQTSMDAQRGEAYVALEFKPRGAQVFADVTGANVGRRFAIVLDGKIKSAPNINEKIPGGRASITMGQGNLDEQYSDAANLALVLRSGALPAPVIVGEVRTVGASLGEQAIKDGVIASFIGGFLVFAFTAFYYRFSGVLADVALLLNVLFVMMLLAQVGATLTLPGICGIALTVGMAVDCNIIIYERIREELRAGKGPRLAIEAGFDRAFVAVLDSNLTTLIAGIVLYSYGTGPIRGFAVTLMIGIFTTLYTGVFVSRAFMEWANHGRKKISI